MNIEATLRRLERKIDRQNNPRPVWVKVSFVKDLTGWEGDKLNDAVDQGLVIRRKDKRGFWYNASSIPQIFIIKKTA